MEKQPTNIDITVLDEDHAHFDLSFKLIVIGDSGVGKSCLTMKATKNIFDEESQATVGFEFFSFNMKINEKIVKLQIWDTCGQEVYRSLITNFYRNSGLAIIVYAINSEKSFDNLSLWLKELKNFASPDVKVIIIGNKTDLESQRKVSKETAEAYAKEVGAELFMEASAKSGLNVKNIFIEAGKLLYQNYLIYGSRSGSRSSSFDTNNIETHNQKVKLPETQNVGREQGGSSKCCK